MEFETCKVSAVPRPAANRKRTCPVYDNMAKQLKRGRAVRVVIPPGTAKKALRNFRSTVFNSVTSRGLRGKVNSVVADGFLWLYPISDSRPSRQGGKVAGVKP